MTAKIEHPDSAGLKSANDVENSDARAPSPAADDPDGTTTSVSPASGSNLMILHQTCPRCAGTGMICAYPPPENSCCVDFANGICPDCSGSGRIYPPNPAERRASRFREAMKRARFRF